MRSIAANCPPSKRRAVGRSRTPRACRVRRARPLTLRAGRPLKALGSASLHVPSAVSARRSSPVRGHLSRTAPPAKSPRNVQAVEQSSGCSTTVADVRDCGSPVRMSSVMTDPDRRQASAEPVTQAARQLPTPTPIASMKLRRDLSLRTARTRRPEALRRHRGRFRSAGVRRRGSPCSTAYTCGTRGSW